MYSLDMLEETEVSPLQEESERTYFSLNIPRSNNSSPDVYSKDSDDEILALKRKKLWGEILWKKWC